ncbi:MAG: hypothetical protein LQ352_003652 [Teloschistes flavicans]|nr:MAG: hypothetical protein LQ352_003652 [Teloschistes flavicans]
MDSEGDRPRDRSVKDERGNPFVTFSRLVDQQISSAFQTLSQLPDKYAEQRRKSEEEWRKWASDPVKRMHDECEEEWMGEKHNHEASTQEQLGRSDEEAAECRRIAQCVLDARSAQYRAEDHDDDEEDDSRKLPLRCPYRPVADDENDEESERAPHYQVRVLPAWFSWGYPQPVPPEDYLTDRQHSSSNDGAKGTFSEHGIRWKKAVEDLLGVQLDPEPSGSVSKDAEETKGDWMSSLQKQAPIDRFPPFGLRDFFEGPATRYPENDAEEDAVTELDLYRRFLGTRSRPGSASHTSSQTFTSTAGLQSDPNKPSVTSTMTTTQRCTLPDGTVYTKVVLKKGFSDGREECTETEHTTHGLPRSDARTQDLRQAPQKSSIEAPKESSLGHDGKVKQALEQKVDERKRGGWFWS